jgi:hypothetical protein
MCCAPASRRVAGDVISAHTENLSEIALSKPLKMAGLQRSKIAGKRVALYCRVSTKDKQTPENQRRALGQCGSTNAEFVEDED